MEIKKECIEYLRSIDVIRILQQSAAHLHSKVFDCLRKYKDYFKKTVLLTHSLVPATILADCADDAYTETENAFYQNVQNNSFEPKSEYCISYVKTIFKRKYYDLYWNEVKEKMSHTNYSNEEEPAKNVNAGEKKLLKKDFLTHKVKTVLDRLSKEDNKYYKLKYVDDFNRPEIAKLLDMLPEAVTTKKRRFLRRFIEEWNKLYNHK